MAPEIEYLKKREKYNNKVDIYSLGLMYLKLLTNDNPFALKNVEYNQAMK